jgi:hypothetical protein
MAQWCVLGVVGLVAATACSDAFGIEDLLGTWSLTSIYGQSVPGTVTIDGESLDVQYVRLTFGVGGDCTLAQGMDGATWFITDCAYTVDLDRKTMAVLIQNLPTFQGSIDIAADRMTLTDADDLVSIWRRQ